MTYSTSQKYLKIFYTVPHKPFTYTQIALLAPAFFLEKESCYFEGFENPPAYFLSRARRQFDLNEYLECVSNASKAVSCRIDELLKLCFLYSSNERRGIPDKLNGLLWYGIRFASNTIKKRITKLRNDIEHRYIIPSEEDSEEALEVAELVVGATNKYCNAPVYLFGGSYNIVLNYESQKIIFAETNSPPKLVSLDPGLLAKQEHHKLFTLLRKVADTAWEEFPPGPKDDFSIILEDVMNKLGTQPT